jgi:hypothetical protein
MTLNTYTTAIDIYGTKISVKSACENLIIEINYAFKYFISSPQTEADIKLHLSLTEPDLDSLKSLKKIIKTKNWTLFSETKNTRAINYNDAAIASYDYKKEIGIIKSVDLDILKELAYLLILSRAGEKLDLKNLHRLHAAAIEINKTGILFCGAQGIGKTTLLLELLKDKEVKLLADDTPILNKDGEILAFPLRIGLCENSPHLKNFKKKDLRYFKRRNYKPKLLVDIDIFKNQITKETPAQLFIISQYRNSSPPSIRPASALISIYSLIKYFVIGFGIPQIAEYFLRLNSKDIIRKSKILLSRIRTALALFKKCEFYIFSPNNNSSENAKKINSFIIDFNLKKAEKTK